MPKKWLLTSVVSTLALAGGMLSAGTPVAQGACAGVAETENRIKHPRLFQGAACETVNNKVPFIAWGQILLQNTTLGNLECVNMFFGYDANQTEPGGAGNSERVKAYGQVDQWSATGFLTAGGTEPLAKCKSTSGLEAWATNERPLHGELADAFNINGAATERLVTTSVPGHYLGPSGTFGLGHWAGRHPTPGSGEGSPGTGTYRERGSLPWDAESNATENAAHEQSFFLRTGLAASPTERAEVESEEAAAGTPEELRTGCYPHPSTEAVHLHPGFNEPTEEFATLRPDPEGCVQVNIIAPEAGVEQEFEGSSEPVATNGAKNCLSPSKAELKGTEERHGYHLESIFSAGFTTTKTAIKECGFNNVSLLRVQAAP
jgi:hypothetical protein